MNKKLLIWIIGMFLIVSPIVFSSDNEIMVSCIGDYQTVIMCGGDNEMGISGILLGSIPTVVAVSGIGGPGSGSGIGDTGCPNGYIIKDGLCVPIKKGIKEIVIDITKGKYNNYGLWIFMFLCVLIVLFVVDKRGKEKAKESIDKAKDKINKGKNIIKTKLKEGGIIDDDEEDNE